MMKRLAKLVTNNFGLKVLAAVFAILLWLIIANVEDPDTSSSFSVKVDIVNADYLTDMGKTYEILDGTDEISFTVTGQRSIVETLTADDFSAVANMENIDDSMSMVPIAITATSYSGQLEITKRDSYLLVDVENLVSEEYETEVVTQGDISAGCHIASASAQPGSVSVSGPESVVEQIASARVTADVSGATDTVVSPEEIELLDGKGRKVSKDRLTLSSNKSTVTVDILLEKKVPLGFEITGMPAPGYRVGEVAGDVNAVTLKGPWDVLNAMDELTVSSPLLSAEGASGDVIVPIHLPDYLPEGISLADGEPQDVMVTIQVGAQTTAQADMPVKNITVTGLADGLDLSFDSDMVNVLLSGSEEELSSVDEKKLVGTLDASGLQEGTYNVAVTLGGDYAGRGMATASVTVTGPASGKDGTSGEE